MQPFIFVAGSSGTGKTQMAFLLLHTMGDESKDLFYFVASDLTVGESQPIYKYHMNMSQTFLECAQADSQLLQDAILDCSVLKSKSLFLFGLMDALLSGKYGSTEKIKVTRIDGSKIFEDIKKMPKRSMVVLDEFLRRKKISGTASSINNFEYSDNWLHLLRNAFRAVSFVVIMMGTEAHAANLLILSKRGGQVQTKNLSNLFSEES